MRGINTFILILLLVVFFSCNKDTEPVPDPETGKIHFVFHHYCDGKEMVFDQRVYTNEAGNEYMVNEIQYFISDVKLWLNGRDYMIDDWKDMHYVDTDIQSTQEWEVYDAFPVGDYDRISFTFGISEEKNQSLMFVDPPESLMFWPVYLGGGYHYMKLNGKWLDTNDFERPFDFHLGIGQEYDPESGEITGFIQNYFEVTVPSSEYEIKNGQITDIHLVMHVDRWFKNPHTYDHNEWGGDIMQTQSAMKVGCENGHDVFEVLGVGF